MAEWDGGKGWRGWRGGRGGQGGGRGWKRGGRYRANQEDKIDYWKDPFEDDSKSGGERGRGRGGRGRPPGLRGKEIGLYYARLGRARKEKEQRPTIRMDAAKENHLSNLLSTIRSNDRVMPQPSRSYRDAFDEEDDTNERLQRHTVKDSWEDNDDEELSCSSSAQNSFSSQRYVTSPSPGIEDNKHADKVLRLETQTFQTENQYSKNEVTPSYEKASGSSKEYSQKSFTEPQHTYFSDEDSGDDVELVKYADNVEEDIVDLTEEEFVDLTGEEDDKIAPNMFMPKEDESEFLTEFLSHNDENRRGRERLSGCMPPDIEIQRKPHLDEQLQEEHKTRCKDSNFLRMKTFREKLPSYNMREEILDTAEYNQVVVISGETGCGKTTQVAQFILDDFIERGRGSLCRIVCTQPRRISAISVAERVADERCENCGGGSIGYQIRLEKKLPRDQGSILFCTTGILLKWLASDPWLSKTSHVILDEIHERDLQSDFLMIVLKDLIKQRSDLKVILMSATLNADMFSKYFFDAPMLNIPGFTFPVTEYLLEDVVEMVRYQPPESRRPRHQRKRGKDRQEQERNRMEYEDWVNKLDHHRYSRQTKDTLIMMGNEQEELEIDLVSDLVEYIHKNKGEGAILVFLPGWDQISKVHDNLNSRQSFRCGWTKLIPLHSLMPTINQKDIFTRPPPGVRKIVIATNIAETSITIDDVVYVVDCGKIKMKNFDTEHNIATLKAEDVSRANARQRRGRAGRVQPGECYHLYTAFREKTFADYQLPEMLRTRLEELCLQIKLLKLGRIFIFIHKAMQPPSYEALEHSIQTLMDINALDDNEDLTPLGYHLAKMPVDPHTGKMLLFAAMFSCLDPVCTIAASLSFKDAFYIPMGKEKLADEKRRKLADGSKSDHIMLSNAFQGWEKAKSLRNEGQYCWDNFMSASTLRLLANMRKQFAELLHDMGFISSSDPKAYAANRNSENTQIVKAVLCAGLYPNVARAKNIIKKGRRPWKLETKCDHSVFMHPKSVNADASELDSQWLIYHLKMKTAKLYLYDCSTVSPYPLLFFGGKINFRFYDGQHCIVVDDYITFKAAPRVAHLVKELRLELDRLLEYKITHPGVTNWNPREKEGALMQAILDLLMTVHKPEITESHR